MLEVQNASIQEQQKETVDMLMGERLDEIERLQDARDAVRVEILKAKKHGGDDTRSQAPWNILERVDVFLKTPKNAQQLGGCGGRGHNR